MNCHSFGHSVSFVLCILRRGVDVLVGCGGVLVGAGVDVDEGLRSGPG